MSEALAAGTLSAADVAAYHERGYLFPIRVLAPTDAARYRASLEDLERARGGPLAGELKQKPHLILTWADVLIRHPRILDAVESLIGPDILCWSSSFFTKEARDPAFVSWHQDLTYWGLEPADIVTAWLALSPATTASGAMRFLPASHHAEILPHSDTFAADNLLSRGQEVAVEVDEARAVDVELAPGEMSLHHVKLVHGSKPNTSDDRRIGFAIRYIPTRVRQTVGGTDSATLVRGSDTHGNFAPERRPTADLDPEALAFHHATLTRQAKVLYRDTGRDPYG